MNLLVAGMILWAVVHLFPAVAAPVRGKLIAAVGEKPYRGAFALVMFVALGMIIAGWRSTPPAALYSPPAWSRELAFLLMFFSIVLFGASHAKTNIKRFVRHPQLSSIILWALAHLVANGDSRSLVLFGGMLAWAMVEIPLINRRQGEWVKPQRAAMRSEMIGIAISVVIFLVLVALHPNFAGVSALPL